MSKINEAERLWSIVVLPNKCPEIPLGATNPGAKSNAFVMDLSTVYARSGADEWSAASSNLRFDTGNDNIGLKIFLLILFSLDNIIQYQKRQSNKWHGIESIGN